MLYSFNPYNEIEVLDLTGNKLTEDPMHFVDILKYTILPFKSIGELILVDNGFDSAIISISKKDKHSYLEKFKLKKLNKINVICFCNYFYFYFKFDFDILL